MLAIFERNSKTTCSMTVDNIFYEWNIPYIPEKRIDHRGEYLFNWCKKRNKRTEIMDFDFLKSTENLQEIARGFRYMHNPIFINEAIKNFKNRI